MALKNMRGIPVDSSQTLTIGFTETTRHELFCVDGPYRGALKKIREVETIM